MNNSFCFNKGKLNTAFIKLMVVDLFFFPNVIFSTTLTFLLFPCVLVYNNKFTVGKIYAFLMLFIIMLTSVIHGSIDYPGFEVENIKRMLQFLMIVSLFFFKDMPFNMKDVIAFVNKVVCVFVFYLIVLVFLSFNNKGLYLDVVSYLSPSLITQIKENVDINRFSYFFSDPNSLGYFLVFISVYTLFFFERLSGRVFFFSLTFVIVVFTQSRGALVSMLLVIVLYVFPKIKFNRKSMSYFVFFVCLSIFVAYIFQDYIRFAIDAFEARREIEASMGTGIGGGRYEKYLYLINNFNFKFYGVGYNLHINGSEFRPHSDFIRLILSYGVFSLIPLCFFLFSRNKASVILLVSFSVPFMINSVIDDYRLFGIFIVFFIMTERYNLMKC